MGIKIDNLFLRLSQPNRLCQDEKPLRTWPKRNRRLEQKTKTKQTTTKNKKQKRTGEGIPPCPLFSSSSSPPHHQSLNREGRWGTTDDFATSFFHFPLFSTALWDLPNSRPVHSLMLSSHLFLCPPCLLPPITVPCKMVLARPDERET